MANILQIYSPTKASYNTFILFKFFFKKFVFNVIKFEIQKYFGNVNF